MVVVEVLQIMEEVLVVMVVMGCLILEEVVVVHSLIVLQIAQVEVADLV